MSLKEIADMTGVSISTVSRILNHPDANYKNKELQAAVLQAAREIHYVPNQAAKNLQKNKALTPSYQVDLLLTRFSDKVEKDVFFSELSTYVQKELLAKGCKIGELYDLPSISHRLSLPAHPSKGLIVMGKLPQQMISELKMHYLHLVGIDRNPTNYDYDEVVCDGEAAAALAMNHLFNLGHKKIAYIGDCNNESRYIGYYNAMLARQLPLNYEDIYPSNQTEEEGYQIFQKIAQRPIRPSAIFCANDVTALGVLKAIKKQKKSSYRPSVISIDNIEEAKNFSPMLTTIEIPMQEMAHLAVNLLYDRLDRRSDLPVRIDVPCRLLVRESCDYFYRQTP